MEAFEEDGVIKDMSISLPKSLLQVKYGELEITPGQVVTPTQVKQPPSCDWDADADSYYTLIMNDPDAPSRADPKFREWHHWCVGNIPGKDISQGEVLSEYVGAGPPKSTKLHRYVLLVYEQKGKLSFSETRLLGTSGQGRKSHSASTFALNYNMQGPVAGNFFQAEFDEYCPMLYKQLGSK